MAKIVRRGKGMREGEAKMWIFKGAHFAMQ